jgi:hypothetical protein
MMKRFIAATSFALMAVPAYSDGLPYDQSLVDRALPDLPPERTQLADAASAGSTRSDVEISKRETAASPPRDWGLASGPWASDHYFIAPAQ